MLFLDVTVYLSVLDSFEDWSSSDREVYGPTIDTCLSLNHMVFVYRSLLYEENITETV